MRAGLTTRLLLATGVLALVVTAAYVALYVALADLSRASAGATHSVQEVNVARDVRRLLIDMETGQRGFIITGEPSFLEPWEIGRRTLPERVATLRKFVDDPGQAKRADQLETDSLAYIRFSPRMASHRLCDVCFLSLSHDDGGAVCLTNCCISSGTHPNANEQFADAIAPVLARVPSHRMSTVAE